MSNSNVEDETDGIRVVGVLTPNLTDKPAAIAAAMSVGLLFGAFSSVDSATSGPHLFFFSFIAMILGGHEESASKMICSANFCN